MGVSISIFTSGGKEVDVTPGWRSMMFTLLEEHNLHQGPLTEDDIPALNEIARDQLKGRKQPPFDWSEDIAESVAKIIHEIKNNDWCFIRCKW